MLFDFQDQKVIRKAEFEGTSGLLAQAGSILWICTLAARILSICGSEIDTEWQTYDRFSEHRSFILLSLKELHFLVSCSCVRPQILCPPYLRYCFHIYIDWCQECPPIIGCNTRTLCAEFEGVPSLLRKPKLLYKFPCSVRAFWVLAGLKQNPNDQVRTVLVNTGPWNNVIFSWSVLARRPKILCPP